MTTRNRAARRRNVWTEVNFSTNVASNTQVGVDLMTNFIGSSAGFTLVRTIMTLHMFIPAGETAGEVVRMDYGASLVSSDAVGASAFPDPAVVPDQVSWVVRDVEVVGAISAAEDPRAFRTVRYDLSSARKMGQGSDRLFLIFNNVLENGAALVRVLGMARLLLKAP